MDSSVDFVGVPSGELSSGSTNSGTSGLGSTISNNSNGNGNGNSNSGGDYLSSAGSNLIMLKKDLDNPYTPHDSGHSSIESVEHQSNQSTSGCRNCGRIIVESSNDSSSQPGTQYETIKLDELFTHVTPSPPPSSSASPAPSSSSTTLRKSIVQNGLCSNCIQNNSNNNKKNRLIDSCSNSPSRTSSIESPSSGIGVSSMSSVILKAESISSSNPTTASVIKPEYHQTFDNNQNQHDLREIMSLIPHSAHSVPTSIITTNTSSMIPSITIPSTTIVNTENNTKMEVKIEEVIPIPAELAMQMMKNMAATSCPTVVTSSHFGDIAGGSYQIVGDPGQYMIGEHYQHIQEEVVVTTDENPQQQMILNSNGNHPSIIYSTSALPQSSYSFQAVPSTISAGQSKTTNPTRKVSVTKRNSSQGRNNADKVYSSLDSVLESIDQVCLQSRVYSEERSSIPDSGEVAQKMTLPPNIKIEVTEQKYSPAPTAKSVNFKKGSTIVTATPTSTIKYNGPIINLSTITTANKSPFVLAKKSAPPIINLNVQLNDLDSDPNYYFVPINSGNPGDRSVACSGCGKSFKNKRLCKAHYQRVHEKLKRFTCHTCGLKFVYKGSLDSHLATHKPIAKFKCNACGQAFKDKSNLSQHIRTQHQQQNFRKFKCEFCPSSFSKRVNARYHMKRKHPDLYPTSNMYLSTYGANNPANSQQQQQQNTMIPQQVPNISGLGCPSGGSSGLIYGTQHHSPSTVNLPSYPSQNYASSSSSSSIIVNTQQQQSNVTATVGVGYSSTNNESDKKSDGNFKCENCGRGFLFKNNLKAHLRTHTRDKKYVCTLCDKGFIYKESLKNHMLLHSNSFPYTCEICHKSFRDRSNRRKHVKNVHKNLLVNGEIPSSFQGTNPASDATGKKPRTRKPKKSLPSTTDEQPSQYGTTIDFTSLTPSTSNTKKNAKKSGKNNEGNKNITNAGNTNNNQSVIVSTNASSSTDLDRGIIMSSGNGSQSKPMEYNVYSSSNLPVTVHIPSGHIPANQSQQQQQTVFSRNVIVKAEPGGTSTESLSATTSRLPNEQSIYLNPGAAPMQQNVIVYPKPKASILETYSTEINQSVIAQNLPQYYTAQGTPSYETTTIDASGNAYTQHLIQTRLSPGGTTSTPPPQQQQFDTNTYIPSANRGRSNSITGTSSIISSDTNESGTILQRAVQSYTTSMSAPPVYSSGGQQQQPGAANSNQVQYQFWSQIPVSSPPSNANDGQQQQQHQEQQQAFYDQQNQTIISTTSPQIQLIQGTQIISSTPNVITVPAYGTSEVLVTTDPSSSNNYYKDFDFSYFMNPPSAQ